MMFARSRNRLSVIVVRLLHTLRLGDRFVARQPGMLVGVLAVVILWAGVLYAAVAERHHAIDDAVERTDNFARAFQEQIIGTVRAIDQTLLYARASYARAPDQFDITPWSERGEFRTNSAFQLSIIDKAGHLVASSLGPITNPIDLGDREHFRIQAAAAEDRLVIGKPVTLRIADKWAIQFTRRMVDPAGSFAGVVSVSFDPLSLSNFYETLHLGSEGVVALVGTDGIIRARAPSEQRGVGYSVADAGLMRSFAHNANGSFIGGSAIDGAKRIYSYRAVEGYPLLVAVGQSEHDALAEYELGQRFHVVIAGAVTVPLLVAVVLLARRQTHLDRTRAALRASEARYAEKSRLLEGTLGNMTQGIMMFDAESTLQVVNRRAAEILDLPEDLLATQPPLASMVRIAWQRGDFGPVTGTFEDWFASFLASHSDPIDIRDFHLLNGTIVEVCSNRLPDGSVVRTFTDITGHRRAEGALRAARDEATRSAQVKSEFLAMMSHEIRSPMSGLLGIIELLRDTSLDAEQGQMVGLVHGSATLLMRVLDDVLNLAKIEAGAVELALEPIDLRGLVAELIDAMAPNAMGHALALSGVVDDDVPGYISTDPVRLRQILTNLLGNAIKFTASGSVSLGVTRAPLPDSTPGLLIAVTDTGIGIAPDIIERLFEPFSQADASTTKLFGGTGLGLTISRRLARLLGGDIVATSKPGQGSVFTLAIPLAETQRPATVDVDEVRAYDGSLGPMRILVAEDQLTNRWLLGRQLERLGCSVTAVEDGHAALVAFDQAEYDLIITDCHMPGTDGIELVRMIRLAEATCGERPIPILGLTADVTAAMRERCLHAGMNDVLAKPIDLRHLHAAIVRVIQAGSVSVVPDVVRTEGEVFDPSTYHELFADDPADGQEWLEAYLASAVDLVARIEQAAARGDRGDLRAAAHRLAGASLSAGAMRLGGLARGLESAAPNASEQEMIALADTISPALHCVHESIEQFLAVRVPVA
jgi:signal transduction histidine kinase/DNA-binding NarL/FixJ family response regulator